MRCIPIAGKQSGFAMIAIVSLIVLMSAYLIASGLGRTTAEVQSDRARVTSKALQDAKAALLGYMARYAAKSTYPLQPYPLPPGSFPCYEDASLIQNPPIATEGNEYTLGPCNTNSNIQFGRLPWKTIGLGDIRDGWGEKLWYVLSPGFRASPINSTTPGQLMLDGVPVVALIIAPGPAINSQARPALPASMPYNYFSTSSVVYGNYLEGANASSPVDLYFTSTGPSETFNDQVIAITQREVFDIVEPIVAARVQSGSSDIFQLDLASYYAQWSAYPFAVPFTNPSTTAQDNYRGVASTYQGLIPATSRSSGSTFVAWSTTPAVTTISGPGSVSNSTCSIPTPPTPMVCVITYKRGTPSSANPNTPMIDITLTLQNAGKAFRQKLDPAAVPAEISYTYTNGTGTGTFSPSPPSNPPAPTQTLDANGNLLVTWSSLRLARFTGGTSSTATKKLTITVETPQDHAILSDWFFANQWYRSMYYAVAPAYAPHTQPYTPSCGSCVAVTNTVTGLTTTANKLVLIRMGRALGAQSQPTGSVVNYLEGANATSAQGGTLSFAQTPPGASSNDITVVAQ